MYHKPDGTMTTSIHEYLVAWNEVAEPIVEATGAQFLGCNPGLTFWYGDQNVVMPESFALKLSQALRAKT